MHSKTAPSTGQAASAFDWFVALFVLGGWCLAWSLILFSAGRLFGWV